MTETIHEPARARARERKPRLPGKHIVVGYLRGLFLMLILRSELLSPPVMVMLTPAIMIMALPFSAHIVPSSHPDMFWGLGQ